VGLHCKQLPASIVVCDFKQRTMSTSAHRATDAFNIGPSAGYISNLTVSMFNKISVMFMISMFIMVVFVVSICSSHVHICVIMNLLLFF
jgi:hypothetical protein